MDSEKEVSKYRKIKVEEHMKKSSLVMARIHCASIIRSYELTAKSSVSDRQQILNIDN